MLTSEWLTGTIAGFQLGCNNLGWFYDINFINGDTQYECKEKRIHEYTEAVHQ
jgi:hypothetical protein